MRLVRYNPTRNVSSYFNNFDRFFNDGFFNPASSLQSDSEVSFKPAADIYEEENSFVIKTDLPGLTREDIELDLKDGILTIKGKRKSEKEEKKENYYRKERSFGSFSRSFSLSETVNQDEIKAEFKNGVLRVELPKKEEVKPKQIEIN